MLNIKTNREFITFIYWVQFLSDNIDNPENVINSNHYYIDHQQTLK